MDKEMIEAKLAAYEAELQKAQVLVYRLEGAIAGLRELLETEESEPPKEA